MSFLQLLVRSSHRLRYKLSRLQCPKSNLNFLKITRNLEENEILHEIYIAYTYCIVSRFPVTFCVISRKFDYLWPGTVNGKVDRTMEEYMERPRGVKLINTADGHRLCTLLRRKGLYG